MTISAKEMSTRTRAIRLVAALLTVASAGGCSREIGITDQAMLATQSDAEARNPITVVEQRPRLDLPVDVYGADSSGSLRLETARFLSQYRRTGSGARLYVSLPRGGAGGHIMHDIRQLARGAGIADGRIAVETHASADRVVRLSYARVAAVTQPCGDWSENADLNRENLPYVNFGCAVQSNMAAMIARPTDVLYPAPETARSAERRATDQRKYNEGVLGKGDDNSKSSVSTAGR